MKSIVVTYPDYRDLPRGLKQLLVTTENFFFTEAKPHRVAVARGGAELFEHWQKKMSDHSRGSLFPGPTPNEQEHRHLAE